MLVPLVAVAGNDVVSYAEAPVACSKSTECCLFVLARKQANDWMNRVVCRWQLSGKGKQKFNSGTILLVKRIAGLIDGRKNATTTSICRRVKSSIVITIIASVIFDSLVVCCW